MSKVTERAAAEQMHSYITTHNLYPSGQSGYHKYHSTETALLKVLNYILLNMNKQHVILLVSFYLSAAFDTVDHTILLQHLQQKFGSSGIALDWFTAHECGVPQHSCLGPLLFVTYTSKWFDIVKLHLPVVHCYTDISVISTKFFSCNAVFGILH